MQGQQRLVDYFVSIGNPIDALIPLPAQDQYLRTNDPLRMLYTPQILDRYPTEDRTDIILPTGLTLFSLPDGMRLFIKPKAPTFFSFVQTSDTGAQLIGCCLTFYEELNREQRKSLHDLIDRAHEGDMSSSAIIDLKLYIPRCICLLSRFPFIASFKKFLCYLYRLSLSPCSLPIERVICNFVDDVPAPPPGKVEVSYLLGAEGVIFKRPPSNEPTAWSTVPMLPLFECLPLTSIVMLLSAVLSERQVVLISSQYSLLTSSAESILSLMFPLKWSHVYIPILPRALLGNITHKYLLCCMINIYICLLFIPGSVLYML
jgi:DENN domain-containing protein 5